MSTPDASSDIDSILIEHGGSYRLARCADGFVASYVPAEQSSLKPRLVVRGTREEADVGLVCRIELDLAQARANEERAAE